MQTQSFDGSMKDDTSANVQKVEFHIKWKCRRGKFKLKFTLTIRTEIAK